MAAGIRHNLILIVLILQTQVIGNQWVSNQFGRLSLITDYFRCCAGNRYD